MKHSIRITAIILLFFFLAQIFGIALLAYEATPAYSATDDALSQPTIEYPSTAIGDRPEFSVDYGPVLYILIGVGVGTLILLGIMRLKKARVIWKWWYFLAVVLTVTAALGVLMHATLALLLAVALAYLKITRYNFYIHNTTEIFMYAGLALLFAPLFSVFWAAVLLLLISIYDMYAVWKSKHMVRLASFTKKTELFAGILVNYTQKGNKTEVVQSIPQVDTILSKKPQKAQPHRAALLGGGDVLFPLLFAGAVFNEFLLLFYTKIVAFFSALVIASCAAIALYLLFSLAKKDKFYPAMPFISIGCFAGYLILRLILLL
jgi:presenilin-like A22 family membrane protease